MSRTVVFLGAGASKPFGYPLTGEILSRIWADLEGDGWRKWAGLKGSNDPAGDRSNLRRLLRLVLPGLGSREVPNDGASIIDVLSLLDQLLVEKRYLAPDLTEESMRSGRSMLQIGINAALRGQRALAQVRDPLVSWLISLATRERGSRMSVVSTNYDTMVDLALFEAIGKAGGKVHECVDFGVTWRNVRQDIVHVRPSRARFAVLKLHGALNWLSCEVCGHVYINPHQRIVSLEFWRRKSEYNSCACGGRLRSLLVTPSVVRDVRDPNLLSVWNAAVEDLRRADEWIFMGYSLPSEDIAIRSLLLRSLHSRNSAQDLRVRVVQYEKTPGQSHERDRYRMFFPATLMREEDFLGDGVEPFVARTAVRSRKEVLAKLRQRLAGRRVPTEL